MAEILTQVFQPESVRDQRRFCLYDDQVFRVPSRGDLQNQVGTGIRRPRGLDPRVHDRACDETLGFRPDTLLWRFTIRADKSLHHDAIPPGFETYQQMWRRRS